MYNKPIELRVDHHSYNDGWNSHTIIVALFDDIQENVPDGWKLAPCRYYHDDNRVYGYTKRFPYGTCVYKNAVLIN